MLSLERKRKYHIKSHHYRTIMTVFGEIKFKRTFYISKINGKSFCYLDRFLGLPKYDYFDPYIKSEILDFVSDNNYSKTAKHINSLIGNRVSINRKEQIISRQTVRNVIMKSECSIPKVKKLKDVEELYIMADEKWISTQNNKKKKVMQKSIIIFDGFNKYGKRRSLNNKMTFSGYGEQFIYESIKYIFEAYNVNKIKRFILLGDGARWINSLKYYFSFDNNTKVIQGLDQFHTKQALWRMYPKKDVYNTLLEYILNNNKKEFLRLTTEIYETCPERRDSIEQQREYIKNNWTKVINLFKYQLSCPMESQISHTFASYFTSRPKGYSTKTIPKLIKLRLLNKNNYNIKELYLNNLNKNEVIDMNKKELNFSIFEKSKNNYFNKINIKPYYKRMI